MRVRAEDSCSKGAISQNLWQPHSFSNGGVREIVILQELNYKVLNKKYFPEDFSTLSEVAKEIERVKKGSFLNLFGAASEYTQNFGKECGRLGLGALPFWSGTNSMTIGTNDGKSDLDAYQFGLGEVKTQGKITLSPRIQEVGVTVFNYSLQNKNARGLYIKTKVTYGATYIDPITDELPAEQTDCLLDSAGTYYPLVGNVRYHTLTEALQSGYSYQMPLYFYGKLQRCKTKYLGTGDSSIVVGVNLVVEENMHFGLGCKFSYPMGNWPFCEYMLEPIFGTAGHPGLGLDISGHYTFALDQYGNQDVSVWLQSDIMHYFPGRKPAYRSFDLRLNGPGSKYLLLQEYEYVLVEGEPQWSPVPDYFKPAINFTTIPVLSSFPVEVDVTGMINYRYKSFDCGIAMELWWRSDERLSLDLCQDFQYSKVPGYDYNLHHYVVVGRQTAFNAPGLLTNWCEPAARINKSVPTQLAENKYPELVKDASLEINHIPHEYDKALDIEGATIRSVITGKFVGECGYTMLKQKNTPRFSVYGGVELSPRNCHVDNMLSFGLAFAIQY